MRPGRSSPLSCVCAVHHLPPPSVRERVKNPSVSRAGSNTCLHFHLTTKGLDLAHGSRAQQQQRLALVPLSVLQSPWPAQITNSWSPLNLSLFQMIPFPIGSSFTFLHYIETADGTGVLFILVEVMCVYIITNDKNDPTTIRMFSTTNF